MKKAVVGCELCGSSAAKTYCESDRARLCWDCDSKVHGANFLVAKHSRALICHLCQSPTPWKAAGANLPQLAMSLCLSCTSHLSLSLTAQQPNQMQNPPDELTDLEDGDYEYDDEEDENDDVLVDDDDDDDDENQVVP